MENRLFRFEAVSEEAILVSVRDPKLALVERNELVALLNGVLKSSPPKWLTDLVPSYDTLLIYFDWRQVDSYFVINKIKELQLIASNHLGKTHKIPVFYGAPEDKYPLDLQNVADVHKMFQQEVIKSHQQRPYRVFSVGFLPNFAYLGELMSDIATPRLKTPRTYVPAGAVAIADRQTAIYPQRSQGGWQILGYTPVDLRKHEGFSVGDHVEFYPIDLPTYDRMKNGETSAAN
ncbi:5-oxoprolinase subunit B family protein [Glaciecola sp. 1036]|uniref:5-oxoprolinase subunit B family protein n=1 Tax=Alteromonadaceae TaxID=72275 RepID=UPI003D08C303